MCRGRVLGLTSALSAWDVESASMIEYCGTPHIEREEKRRKQTISKEGDLLCLLDIRDLSILLKTRK